MALSPTVRDLVQWMHAWAPPELAEDYDNPGLIAGNPGQEVRSVLVSLDATPPVVEEARDKNCQLVISHHPILFRGLKKLSGSDYVSRALRLAIRHDIGLLAAHTNLDHVHTGVNFRLAETLGLQNPHILRPVEHKLYQLTWYVPEAFLQTTLNAVHKAGAGKVGTYSHCSFSQTGTGRFRPTEGANPFIGTLDQDEEVAEYRAEVVVPAPLLSGVIRQLKEAHPYETLAYFVQETVNEWGDVGSGMMGNRPEPISETDFIREVKNRLGCGSIRHSKLLGKPIQKVAICGGAGSFLIRDAIRAGAQVLVTGDLKYHEYFDAEDQILLVDAGHFETEQFTSHLIQEKLSRDFPNIAVLLSETRTNPVFYA